ncbi:hypothetical protein BY458DRAFT_131116 [Sporodiniella umbellata]|nr:hypothetical protein BY458DRAFT_131116 [Sporodiniella umbellata]
MTSQNAPKPRNMAIEYIQDRRQRQLTYSKRKTSLLKQAQELSTLTGTQILLLLVSDSGTIHTFTSSRLDPIVTQSEHRDFIQTLLDAE